MKLPEPVNELSDTPKRVEILVGGYPQQEYAGVYEREDEMLNGRPIYVQINQVISISFPNKREADIGPCSSKI